MLGNQTQIFHEVQMLSGLSFEIEVGTHKTVSTLYIPHHPVLRPTPALSPKRNLSKFPHRELKERQPHKTPFTLLPQRFPRRLCFGTPILTNGLPLPAELASSSSYTSQHLSSRTNHAPTALMLVSAVKRPRIPGNATLLSSVAEMCRPSSSVRTTQAKFE
jgi:hypothetical protein